MQELLTVREISQKLKVTEQCVYEWIYDGKLKALKIEGIVRIEENEFNRFIGKNGNATK